ncbi:NAD(P)H-hydrate epimerase [Pseudoroseicyclus aestuarii]|uniref:Bifunctional NAD(P)H-hydrate repair enzyme n=1 Tax=Pseudoroseicyclus aestuarii TaxID=1795041 RepID=A0A318SYP7_9RHOB|nr:NAD(P)H-hydrate epimerase [Pseudoroseicyclus aestuarii]PYE85506.1 hydroxyethylthiazole kinase-like uncharacterized protein yjeF/hydroxyethylthiazole kinase-like uncharacterized protein yjeF [Pseudoroseicyclus aestuarii]
MTLLPLPLLTAAEMREAEAAAMAGGAVTGLDLMERAGAGAVEALLARLGPEAQGRALVLCGPGNNGGDGFVVARLLAERGWRVTVHAMGGGGGDAATARTRWEALGPVRPMDEAAEAVAGTEAAVIVDALFGTGLTRALDLPVVQALARRRAAEAPPFVLAIDTPSGLDADSGRVLGQAVSADLTVSFHTAKPGHVLAEGPAHCGSLRVCDIGLPPAESAARLVAAPEIEKRGGHKFDYGHALVLSGGVGRGGAARMAARGALRIGAGLVTLGCPPAAVIENAAQLDAVMLRPLKDADALRAMLEDARLNALCLGPGLGTWGREAALTAAALASGRRAVLDGDALTLISQDAGLMAALHPGCLLTPHEGEFKRLFPQIHERLVAPATTGPAVSRIDAARQAASEAGCTVLLKGPDTVIADPSGAVRVHAGVYQRAAPWLATAGAGDTLAGFACGLLARGLPPLEAAAAAAYLHVSCALEVGPGLIAEDLPEALPAVLRGMTRAAQPS